MTTNAPFVDLGTTYEAIHDDVATLHETWDLYRHLFVNPEAVELLNQFCPSAASTIHDALLDSVLLQITRLTEAGKRRLTLWMLIHAVPATPELAARLREQLESIIEAVVPFREHRNKRIAHTDVHHALADNVELARFSRETVERALAGIRDLMNTVSRECQSTTTEFESPLVVGGGEALVAVFRMADRLGDLQSRAWDPKTRPEEVVQMLRRRDAAT